MRRRVTRRHIVIHAACQLKTTDLESILKTRKIWSGVFTPSGEVDFTLNRGGIRQGMLQGGPPRDDPSPILIGKIH